MSLSKYELLTVGTILGSLLAVLTVTTPLSPTQLGSVVVLGIIAILGSGVMLLARQRPIWAAVLGIAILVRLPYMTLLPIHDDGQFYLLSAEQFLAGLRTGHLVLTQFHLRYFGINVVMGGFVALVGDAGANVASLVASLGTIPLLGATATNLFDSRRVGVATGLLMAVFPLHIYYSSWAYSEPITLFMLTLSLYGIVQKRSLLAISSALTILFMRFEYTLFILLPLVALLYTRHTRLYYLFSGGPLVAYCVLLISPNWIRRLSVLVTSLNRDLLFARFLHSIGFIQSPTEHVARNLSYYVPHLLHWGVPYWEPILINPLLLIFFVTGLIVTFMKVRSVLIGVALLAFVGAVGFVLRETITPAGALIGALYGRILLLVGIGTVGLLLLANLRDDRRLQPLLATGPYISFVSIIYLGPRYILPVALIALLYAGKGLDWLYDELCSDVSVSINLPFITVRRFSDTS